MHSIFIWDSGLFMHLHSRYRLFIRDYVTRGLILLLYYYVHQSLLKNGSEEIGIRRKVDTYSAVVRPRVKKSPTKNLLNKENLKILL